MISRKNFNYSTKISFWFWLQNVVPKRLGFRVNFRNHFLGFVSCSDSAKIVGFFGFLIASLPQTKIVLEVFVKALGKNQKKIPFHCKTTEKRGLQFCIYHICYLQALLFSAQKFYLCTYSIYKNQFTKALYSFSQLSNCTGFFSTL